MIKKIIQAGTVFWITGLSGVGKSTIGRLLVDQLRCHGREVLFIDGDEFRSALMEIAGYSHKDRLQMATIYSNLCRLFSLQGFDVVCSTISMFHETQKRNRESMAIYKEIYIKSDINRLIENDKKGVYRTSGEVNSSIVGVDMAAQEPINPDLIVRNDWALTPQEIVNNIWVELQLS